MAEHTRWWDKPLLSGTIITVAGSIMLSLLVYFGNWLTGGGLIKLLGGISCHGNQSVTIEAKEKNRYLSTDVRDPSHAVTAADAPPGQNERFYIKCE